jgi:DNA-binding NarL/FixJ family response regulator
LRLLIADDSAALRERLTMMFSSIPGIEVVGQAADVPTAAAAISRLRPDIVVLDIQMPGGSGIDVLREVKHSWPDTVAMMLTNHPYPQYQQRCAELGADYFLCKSVDSRVLIEIGRRLAAKESVHE